MSVENGPGLTWERNEDGNVTVELDDLLFYSLNDLSDLFHEENIEAGWWKLDADGALIPRNKGELLALIHSEISECLEGVRKDQMDDKLPHRKMEEVELADALIRIFDYAGAHKLDLGGAVKEKRAYNKTRADHKPENRAKEGGKKF